MIIFLKFLACLGTFLTLFVGVAVCVAWGVAGIFFMGKTARMVINGGKLDHELDDRMNTFANVDLME